MRVLSVLRANALIGRLVIDAGLYVFYYMPGQKGECAGLPSQVQSFTELPFFFRQFLMNKNKREDREYYLASKGLPPDCSDVDELAAVNKPSPTFGFHFEEYKA